MYTPAQVAKIANLHPNTIRKYSTDYAELLSIGARGESGPRLYTDEDVDTMCAIAALRKSGMLPAAVLERIRADAAPVVDIEATQALQTVSTAPQPTEPVQSSLRVAYNALQTQIDALQRQMDARRQDEIRAAEIRGATLALVAALFLLVFAWLLVNGAPW